MSTVKENSLNVEAAQTALMYLRLVVDRFTGDSKLIKIEDLQLAVSNIDGLAALLAASQALVTGHENEIPKFNLSGQIEGSGINVGTFSTDAELAALVDDGTYTFVYDTAYVSLPLCGIVYFVAINNGHRILYTDNGLWHSTYFGGWGLERYIGGAFDNITISYADAVSQVAASQLSPGASYKITGTGQNVGLILRAASANEFESDGILLALIPKHSIGTHPGIVWKGHWADTLTAADVTEDDHFIYFGKVYRSLTGEVGTATTRVLDATNWLPLDPFTETDFYTQVTHGCSYKLVSSLPLVYTTGFIFSRWDAKGNTLSEIVEDADWFTSDMNDWHLAADGGEFHGNILRRIYNNTIASTNKFVGNSGNGDIYDMTDCNVTECVLPDDNNNIRHCIGSSIQKCVLGGLADIQYLANGSGLYNNTINGDVKGDAAVYSMLSMSECDVAHGAVIKDLVSGTFSRSVIRGTIDGNKINSTVTMEGCYIGIDNGQPIVSNNETVSMSRVRVEDGCSIINNTGTLSINDSVLGHSVILADNVDFYMSFSEMLPSSALATKTFTEYAQIINSVIQRYDLATETISANLSVRESRSKITGSFYVGAGTFTVPTGGSYNAMTVVTGCVGTVIRENGVTVDATSDRVLVAKHAGWHRFKYTSSVLCQTINTIMESIVYVNGTPVQAGYNIKSYTAIDAYVNASISIDLLLAVGDVVSVRYKHNKGGTITFALGQINNELEYNN